MRNFVKYILTLVFVVTTSCAQQKKYISYKVKEGETMKSIAKRLDMKTRDLLRLNPDVSRRPDANTIIVIPNKTLKENEIIRSEEVSKKDSIQETITVSLDSLKKEFVIHFVAQGETLYSLSKKYNVTEEHLKNLNPELEEGLKYDNYIKIRRIAFKDEDVLVYRDSVADNTSVKLAMLLPFKAVEYDTLSAARIFNRNRLANITTDLYLGAQLAVDSLRSLGVNVVLDAFDTGRRSQHIDQLLRENDFNKYDALVGPLYSEEIPVVTSKTKVPVIYPIYSTHQGDFSSSQIVKTAPDNRDLRNKLVAYLKDNHLDQNIVVIGDGSEDSVKECEILKNDLMFEGVNEIHILNKSILGKQSLVNVLDQNVANWIVLATDNEVITSNVINSLISLPVLTPEMMEEEDFDDSLKYFTEPVQVTLITYKKSDTYDKIDNNKLAEANFIFSSNSCTNLDNRLVEVFYKQYEEKYSTFPTDNAIRGFDIVFDIGMRMASGKRLDETFDEGASFRVNSQFKYIKEASQATINNGVFILQYNKDLTVKKLQY